jgi:hypothetical protein
MNERQFNLYRLSVALRMPNSPYQATLITAIKHKLMSLLEQESEYSANGRDGDIDRRIFPPRWKVCAVIAASSHASAPIFR